MRVGSDTFLKRLLTSLQGAQDNSRRALASVADGKRVRTASDDPIAASSALKLRAAFAESEGRRRAGELGQADLRSIESTMGELVNQINAAISAAVAAGSDVSVEERQSLAIEIDSIREEVLARINLQQDGRYLFSGTDPFTAAFDDAGTYGGSTDETEITLATGRQVGITLDGSRVLGASGANLLTELSDLAVALRADDDAGIQAAQGQLDARLDSLVLTRQDVGERLNAITDSLDFIEGERFRIQERLSELEDASLPEAITEAAQAESAVTAASSVLVRTAGRSLFDFFA